MELEQPVGQPNSNTSNKPERKDIKIACFTVNLTVANIFVAFLSIACKVGMNVTLPLWVDSTILTPSGRHSNYGNHTSNGPGHFLTKPIPQWKLSENTSLKSMPTWSYHLGPYHSLSLLERHCFLFGCFNHTSSATQNERFRTCSFS